MVLTKDLRCYEGGKPRVMLEVSDTDTQTLTLTLDPFVNLKELSEKLTPKPPLFGNCSHLVIYMLTTLVD